MRSITIELEAGKAKISQEDLHDMTLPEWITLAVAVMAAAKTNLDGESWRTVLTMATGFEELPRDTVADEWVKAMGPGEFSTLEPK